MPMHMPHAHAYAHTHAHARVRTRTRTRTRGCSGSGASGGETTMGYNTLDPHRGMWSRLVDNAVEADGLAKGRAVCVAGTDASTGKVRDAHERRGVGSGRVL